MSIFEQQYQTIVVGAGVAGCHAALAAASDGAETLLLASSWDTASCLAWGPRLSERLVSAIRCPGGLTRHVVNRTAIFKGLVGKEIVVLVDVHAYQSIWKHQLEKAEGIEVFQDTCNNIRRVAGRWRVDTGWGASFTANTVVVAAGTFLGATVRVDDKTFPGGRPGEISEQGLLGALRGLGAQLNTCARRAAPAISGPIEWDRLELSASSELPTPSGSPARCVTGLYSFGVEESIIYVEPMSGSGNQYYLEAGPTGSSAGPTCGAASAKSLTELEICNVPGLEKTRVISPAYEVSFYRLESADAVHSLNDRGLYFAGQVAGATRYEESVEQGLRAGKAAAKNKRRSMV